MKLLDISFHVEICGDHVDGHNVMVRMGFCSTLTVAMAYLFGGRDTAQQEAASEQDYSQGGFETHRFMNHDASKLAVIYWTCFKLITWASFTELR
ncbi:hypothetical protein DSO57_1034975 [Entomophthora muscae]|uniref:Uncharacterized protein n=1 Tax=Entomophthora muscae TaxID=34485 RepID=A0ACC2U8N8_9FUNG|nr:hypothetical protein DSO57_1034975 [Entomophthora muscae]